MGHYQQALMFNPRHRSAREHLGELYLTLGEPIKAEEQLAALKEICLIPCHELTDLERAISAYKAAARPDRRSFSSSELPAKTIARDDLRAASG